MSVLCLMSRTDEKARKQEKKNKKKKSTSVFLSHLSFHAHKTTYD